MRSTKLFCIPYSGGSSSVYYKWKRLLHSSILLCPLELAGRGRRMKEPFYESVAQAAEDISSMILSQLQPGEPYAIYGHSMGSLLAYETYFALKAKGAPEPEHIFFSGRKAPQDESEKSEYYKLPEAEFLNVVFHYGGNTREIMQNRELLDLFVPILRADFKIAEIYEYRDHGSKIQCECTVVNGRSDRSISKPDVVMWSELIEGYCQYRWISGEHFFLSENAEATAKLINEVLAYAGVLV
ncbi:MAG: thioesterase [Oscillospiraceae bacterium]|nr:thioesterase [Oscillospiraceae bacterium]